VKRSVVAEAARTEAGRASEAIAPPVPWRKVRRFMLQLLQQIAAGSSQHGTVSVADSRIFCRGEERVGRHCGKEPGNEARSPALAARRPPSR
jgi:hypothetical protein